jgi:hypothetical protein
LFGLVLTTFTGEVEIDSWSLVGDKLEPYHGWFFLVAWELLPLKSLSATVLESAAAKALCSFSMNTFSILFA